MLSYENLFFLVVIGIVEFKNFANKYMEKAAKLYKKTKKSYIEMAENMKNLNEEILKKENEKISLIQNFGFLEKENLDLKIRIEKENNEKLILMEELKSLNELKNKEKNENESLKNIFVKENERLVEIYKLKENENNMVFKDLQELTKLSNDIINRNKKNKDVN